MKTNTKECCYCGAPADTRDHVIPRCLFDASAGHDLITVPPCQACNESFSKDEEYFRAYILAQSYDNPEAKRIWDSKVRRSLKRSPGLRRRIAGELALTDILDQPGRLGQAVVWKGDENRIERVLKKIVQGLYFHHQRVRLEANSYLFWPKPRDPLVNIWQRLTGYKIGGDVCIWWPAFARGAPTVSMWWLVFYQKVLYIAATNGTA